MQKLIFTALLVLGALFANQVTATNGPQHPITKSGTHSSILSQRIFQQVAAETEYQVQELRFLYQRKILTITKVKTGSYWVSFGREGGGLLVILSEING